MPALNLWVSSHDLPEHEMTRERFDAAVRRLEPLYAEVGVAAPPYPARFAPGFEAQAEAVLEVRPTAFSVVFGVPDERVLAAFRDAGVVTLGTATTPDEAVALDEAGIEHGEILDLEDAGMAILSLQDPDDINVELTAPLG